MIRFGKRLIWSISVLVAMILVACGGQSIKTVPTSAPTTAADSSEPANDEGTAEETQAPTDSGDATTFDLDDWQSVEDAARGQTVNWYMWGGSETINRFVDEFYGTALQRRYDITLNRVPVADAIDFVNLILSEKEAAIDPGSVDLLWINGENFATLKQADMLYSGWTRKMPNSAYVQWENPALNRDFGEPIEELESPWSSAQLQLVYDSARMSEEELPRSYTELKEWACEHPGRVTYIAPGPGAFQGTRFVKGILYEISDDPDLWSTFDQETWDEWSPKLWEFLNEMESCLWQEGKNYPKDENEMHNLFSNQEIDFSITQIIAGTGPLIVEGLLPETARAFVLDKYMIGDYNYVAIPANAPNKAAALVLANLLLEPQFQAAQIIPENGFGLGYGIDVTLVPESSRKVLEEAAERLSPYATPAEDLVRAMASDMAPEYQTTVEDGWRDNVLMK